MRANHMVLAVVFLSLAACAPAQQTTRDSQASGVDPNVRYMGLFYPNGMPTCGDPDDPNGKKVKATFRFYGDITLPFAGQTAVLYSKDCELRPGTGSDFEHALYLAIGQASGQQLRVIRIHDLTEKIPIELEEPG